MPSCAPNRATRPACRSSISRMSTRGATGFDYSVGNPASGVRGASAAVRVFHNEFKFRLGSDTTDNLNTQFQKYLRTWKVDTKETYLTDGGL